MWWRLLGLASLGEEISLSPRSRAQAMRMKLKFVRYGTVLQWQSFSLETVGG